MITIIIPVHNKWSYTKECINSICLDRIDEVIVIDNASTDETAEMLASLPVKTIKSETNLGFGEGCNLGLKLAKSEYVYITNNDVVFNKTTITALHDRLLSDNRLGAVGSKVIHPHGFLIEAGAYFTDNKAWQRGCRGNASDYNEFDIVDYCSACSLLVRKNLIPNGFDEKFSPGYYEDVDLCNQIKHKGYLIGYEPLSTILHHENTTFLSQDIDREKLTERNRIKYIEKWSL